MKPLCGLVVVAIVLCHAAFVLADFQSENNEWDYMRNVGAGTSYYKYLRPRLYETDADEAPAGTNSTASDAFYETRNGNWIYELSYNLTANSVLGYSYATATFRYQSQVAAVPKDASSLGGFLSIWMKGNPGETVRVSVVGAQLSSSYWTVTLNGSDWVNYKLSKNAITDTGLPVDWTSLVAVTVSIPQPSSGVLSVTLISFTDVSAPYSLPMPTVWLNDEFYALNGPTAPTPIPTTSPRTGIDAYSEGSTSRLAVVITDEASTWLGLAHGLKSIGVPFKLYRKSELASALQHKVVMVYPDLASYLTAGERGFSITDRNNLISYVQAGGIVIASWMVNTDQYVQELFGVTGVTESFTKSAVVFNLTNPGPHFEFTDAKEREVSIWSKLTNTGFKGFGYTVAAPENVIAMYKVRNSNATTDAPDTEAAIVGKTHTGGGRAYAVGVNIGYLALLAHNGRDEGMERSYSNSYEPCLDIFFRFIKNIYEGRFDNETASSSNNTWASVTVNAVPNNKKVGLILTHNLDSASAFDNAVAFAQSEADMNIRATYFVNTKYTRDAAGFSFFLHGISDLEQISAMGHELGSHAILHALDYATFPIGTGTEFFQYMSDNGGYYPVSICTGPVLAGACPPGPQYCDYGESLGLEPNQQCGQLVTANLTIMGETRVSKFLVESVSNLPCVSFRPGSLKHPAALTRVVKAVGYEFTSLALANDYLTHLPFQLNEDNEVNAEMDLFEFPATFDDITSGSDMNGNFAQGSLLYSAVNTAARIANYGGYLVVMSHPKDVVGLNYRDKILFQEGLIQRVRGYSHIDTMANLGAFWRARDSLQVDWTMTNATSPQISINAPLNITGLTLRVPNSWALSWVSVSPQSVNYTVNFADRTLIFTSMISGDVTVQFDLTTPSQFNQSQPTDTAGTSFTVGTDTNTDTDTDVATNLPTRDDTETTESPTSSATQMSFAASSLVVVAAVLILLNPLKHIL